MGWHGSCFPPGRGSHPPGGVIRTDRFPSLLLCPAILISASTGCVVADDDFAWADPLGPDDTEPVVVPTGPHSGLHELAGRLGEADVVENEALADDPGCIHPMDDCRADCLAFPERAVDHADPLPDEELLAWIQRLLAEPRLTEPVDHDDLADVVVDGLAIRFPLDELGNEPLRVRIHADEQLHGYRALRAPRQSPRRGGPQAPPPR